MLAMQNRYTLPTSSNMCGRRRSPVYGTRGMVSCSQPLAAEAGLRILQSGGNAADAAVAVAAALGVTEPCSTGVCWAVC
jgi:gamma-glutamyltranspeptidase/glutathione hydrolase